MAVSGCPTAAAVPVGGPGVGRLCPSLPPSARAGSARRVCRGIGAPRLGERGSSSAWAVFPAAPRAWRVLLAPPAPQGWCRCPGRERELAVPVLCVVSGEGFCSSTCFPAGAGICPGRLRLSICFAVSRQPLFCLFVFLFFCFFFLFFPFFSFILFFPLYYFFPFYSFLFFPVFSFLS